tara:strand:- start:429 stop:1061 length:633 start_codon:yes stop_codon:yes gene_type:complete
MKNNDVLDVSGHLEIYKIFADGQEEQVFDDANTITSGMGVGLGLLYAGSGAADITNFQLRYFQLGVGGAAKLTNYGVSEVALVSALGQVDGNLDYQSAVNSNIPIAVHQLMDWDGAAKATVGGTYGNEWRFGVISDNSIKRVDLNSVTYILYVDRSACNELGASLNEIGLYMQNPLGYATKRSQLCAYRPFTNILKTEDFALVFKWTLNF